MASTLETERKILFFVTGLTVLGILFIMISLATDYWVILEIPNGVYRNSTNAYVTSHHSGLWRICRSELNNATTIHFRSKYESSMKSYEVIVLKVFIYSRDE